MSESQTESSLNSSCNEEIPIEIVSEEEMALIEAAMASARALCLPSRHFHANARSVQTITALSKRSFPIGDEPSDFEDLGLNLKKKTRLISLVLRYRKKNPMRVTDFTASEWCEKKTEFSLVGRRVVSKVMQLGIDRHAELEEEVVKKVEVHVDSDEDRWALKLLNFVIGANQLLFEGVTRELPVICLVEGEWVTGVIDEIQMPGEGIERKPLLVDVKTRSKPALPSEPQQRNGRLQLMIYKHMWDSLVSSSFPAKKFFERFSLNPYEPLSESIFDTSRNMGLPATTLEDMSRYFTNTCSMLPMSLDEMILRYEFQKDKSLLGEDRFENDPEWLMKQIRGSLEFWRGGREANYVPEEERWKCSFCAYASQCSITNSNLENESTSSSTNSTPDEKPRSA